MHRARARALARPGHHEDDDRDQDRADCAAGDDQDPVAPAAAGFPFPFLPEAFPGRGAAGFAHYVPAGPLHAGHSPNNSTVWSTAVNPASAATCSAQRSTARPSTSTLVPQERQMR